MIADGYEFLCQVMKIGLTDCDGGFTTVDTLQVIKLYIING